MCTDTQLPYRESRAGPDELLAINDTPVGDTRTSLSLNNRHFRSPIRQTSKKRDHDYDTCLIVIDIRYSRTQLALPNRRHISRPPAHSDCTDSWVMEAKMMVARIMWLWYRRRSGWERKEKRNLFSHLWYKSTFCQ